jgi:hypothetical protein
MDETPPTISWFVGQLQRLLVVDDVVSCRYIFSNILQLGLLEAGGIGYRCLASRSNQQAQHQRVPVKHLASLLAYLGRASRLCARVENVVPCCLVYSRNESKRTKRSRPAALHKLEKWRLATRTDVALQKNESFIQRSHFKKPTLAPDG